MVAPPQRRALCLGVFPTWRREINECPFRFPSRINVSERRCLWRGSEGRMDSEGEAIGAQRVASHSNIRVLARINLKYFGVGFSVSATCLQVDGNRYRSPK